MTVRRVGAWARARTPIEWLALTGAVAVFFGIGWDPALWDPRLQLALHAIGAGAIVGTGLAAWRGRLALPSTPLDLPILALLAAFALATVSAVNVGMSLRAVASIAAFAAMLPLAIVAVRARPSWVGTIVSVPVLLLSIPTLGILGWRRVEWLLAGAPGLPPLRLPAEGTPFGSVAVPPFMIWPAWALAGLIEAPAWRRGIRAGLVAVGIPLTILSGSRSAWLAIGLTAVVVGIPWLWRRRTELARWRQPTPGRVAVALLAAGAGVLVLLLALPRLTAVTSLLYRVSLWRDTLAAWASDPLLGIGPGFMPIARQGAAADFSFPVRQPHSHNLPLGVLGDAGLVGLLAAVLLVITLAWVAGPWRARTRVGRQAATVLLGLGIGGLFEDLTFEPNFNLLAIGLVAVAITDAGAVRWVPFPVGGWRRPLATGLAAVTGVVLAGAMVVSDAGAIAYRAGLDASVAGRPDLATAWFERAIEIDPWHPAGPKSLAVTAATAGDLERARQAAERAVAMNPGDAPSWTNLALTCAALDDAACTRSAAQRAAATAAFGEPDPYNAAVQLERLGRPDEADAAYRWSLVVSRFTVFAPPWPREVTVEANDLTEDLASLVELNLLLAAWDAGGPIDPGIAADPADRALAHAMRGERAEAEAWIDRAIAEQPEDVHTWDVAVVLHEHWGTGEADRLRRIAEVVRSGPFPWRDASRATPAQTRDIAVFRGYPGDELLPSAERLATDPPWPWVLEVTLPPP